MARRGRCTDPASRHAIEQWIVAHSTPTRQGLWCWLWNGACDREGYGHMSVDGHTCRVHRVVWARLYGTIPEGLHVLHKCDNPGCIKPSHLLLGTQQANVAQMDRHKRRNAPTVRNPQGGPVLSLQERQALIRRFNAGEGKKSLAKRFHVSMSTIRRRLTKDAHLTEEP